MKLLNLLTKVSNYDNNVKYSLYNIFPKLILIYIKVNKKMYYLRNTITNMICF